MAIWVLIFACTNVVIAGHHANLIKRMEKESAEFGAPKTKIQHGWWLAGYLIAAGLVSYFAHSWWLAGALLFVRKWSFDLPLNKFRGLGWSYVSPELKNITGLWDSIRKGKTNDWIHYRVFGRAVWVYMTAYFLLTVWFTIQVWQRS